jgi:integrase
VPPKDLLKRHGRKSIHVVSPCCATAGGRRGWIASNTPDHADPGEILEEEIEPPEDVDIIRILAEAESLDPRLALYLLVSAETGARRGAMHALRWTYLDLSSGTLRSARDVRAGALNRAHCHLRTPGQASVLACLRPSEIAP